MEDLICFKQFEKTMERLSGRHQLERVFSDFLVLATCAYHPQTLATPGINPDAENEVEYLAVAGRYTRDELNLMAELLGLLVFQVNAQPYSDLVGEYFTEHVTRGRNGQFFTPDSICRLMARMGTDAVVEGKTINDPACGSGRTLLAFAEESPRNLFFAADVDMNCARMTALNFYLNGMRGEVVCMNTLSLQAYRAWHINDSRRGIAPVPLEKAWQVPRPAEQLPAPVRREEPAFVPSAALPVIGSTGGQLRLF